MMTMAIDEIPGELPAEIVGDDWPDEYSEASFLGFRFPAQFVKYPDGFVDQIHDYVVVEDEDA